MRSKCTWHCKMTLTLTLICCSTVVFHTPVIGDPELVQSAASTKPVFLKNIWMFPYFLLKVCVIIRTFVHVYTKVCVLCPLHHLQILFSSELSPAQPSPTREFTPHPSLFHVQSVSLFCIFNFADVLAEVRYSIIMLFLDLYFQPVKLVPCFFSSVIFSISFSSFLPSG